MAKNTIELSFAPQASPEWQAFRKILKEKNKHDVNQYLDWLENIENIGINGDFSLLKHYGERDSKWYRFVYYLVHSEMFHQEEGKDRALKEILTKAEFNRLKKVRISFDQLLNVTEQISSNENVEFCWTSNLLRLSEAYMSTILIGVFCNVMFPHKDGRWRSQIDKLYREYQVTRNRWMTDQKLRGQDYKRIFQSIPFERIFQKVNTMNPDFDLIKYSGAVFAERIRKLDQVFIPLFFSAVYFKEGTNKTTAYKTLFPFLKLLKEPCSGYLQTKSQWSENPKAYGASYEEYVRNTINNLIK